MANVIMLDIDDCVSCDRSIRACTAFDERTAPGFKIPRAGDAVALALINRACWCANAKIVVISSWLYVVGWEYTCNWLIRNGLDPEHLHADPATRFGPFGDKRQAAQDWLKQHPEVQLSAVCVIDDDTTLFHSTDPLRRRQVVIDGEDGICLCHYRSIIRMLGATDRNARVSS